MKLTSPLVAISTILFVFALCAGASKAEEDSSYGKLGSPTADEDWNNNNERKLQDEATEAATKTLVSEECADFMKSKSKALEDLMKFSDHTITGFVCNPIERKALKKITKKMEQDAAAEVVEPCQLAYDKIMVLGGGKTVVDKALGSIDECRKEAKKEIKAAKEALERRDERRRRALVATTTHPHDQVDHYHRELLPIFVFPAAFTFTMSAITGTVSFVSNMGVPLALFGSILGMSIYSNSQ